MLKHYYFLLIIGFPFLLQGQSFEVEISNDSILIGNYIEVRFIAENVTGKFEAPAFENLEIIGGPNTSNSIEILNGDQSSKTSWSYFIRPSEMGETIIEPAFLVTDEKTFETDPIILNVYPNPDGIIENPKQERDFSIFDNFDFPFRSLPKEPKKEKPKKSKRKLKRI